MKVKNGDLSQLYVNNYIFYFFQLIYFSWRIIPLQYCDGICHTSTWISHRYTCAHPNSEFLSCLPPHTIPLRCPRGPALGALLNAANVHWSSILHMAIYMFQSYSHKSSHPHLLPLSPKVCSLHLCLLCCPACRIVITILLNSKHMH